MTLAPDEAARLNALLQSRVLDTPRERELEDLVRLAASVTHWPIAMLSFVDRDRLWLKAVHGMAAQELPRARSFCDSAIQQATPFTVEDATVDPRFADYVLVTSSPHARSYAAVPLHAEGCVLGTLAVLHTEPRQLEREQLEALELLGRQVDALLELRRLRDTRLLKTEALLASATRMSRIGGWQWNLRTHEVTWLNELYDIFGLPRSQTPTLEAFQQCVHPDDREQMARRTAIALEGGLTEFSEFRVLRPDGQVRIVEGTAELERDEHGRPFLLTGALLDVTEQRRAEAERKRFTMQLMHSQKLESLGVLSAGVAHDFNNLLVGILGNAELASADVSLSDYTRDLLARVTESAIQAADLTRQLLAYTGRGPVELSELDLSQHTETVLGLVRHSLPASILVTSELGKRLPMIRADSDQLQQITLNLLMNACEAYPDQLGELRVRTYETETSDELPHNVVAPTSLARGRYVVLEVSDDGSGMCQETLDRMFEPFFSTKFTGRGLGLAAVLGIARAHGAVLTVDSALETGSRFRVYFPALEQSARPAVPRARRPALASGLTGCTVLVVDDEARVRQLERRVLEEYGVRVLEAGSGEQAVQLLGQLAGPLHVVLLDLIMPGLDAASTLRAMRGLRPELLVVIQSGYPEEEVFRRLHEVDAELPFLQKPFSPKTLISMLDALLVQSNQAED